MFFWAGGFLLVVVAWWFGLREFFARWKNGLERVSPLQQARAKRLGSAGQVLGMVLAIVLIGLQGLWFWVPFLLFTLVVLIVDLLGVHQQVKAMERLLGGGM